MTAVTAPGISTDFEARNEKARLAAGFRSCAVRRGSSGGGALFLGPLDAALQALCLSRELGVGRVDEERVDAAIMLDRAQAGDRDAQLHRQVEAVAPERG